MTPLVGSFLLVRKLARSGGVLRGGSDIAMSGVSLSSGHAAL